VGLARDLYPNLDFGIGTMSALPHSDASFAGLVAWYSIIHIPDAELAGVFAEAARVFRPGGWLQLAFQLGDRVDHFADLAGTAIARAFPRRSFAQTVSAHESHGFSPVTRLEREPERAGRFPEANRQGYLLVRRSDRRQIAVTARRTGTGADRVAGRQRRQREDERQMNIDIVFHTLEIPGNTDNGILLDAVTEP